MSSSSFSPDGGCPALAGGWGGVTTLNRSEKSGGQVRGRMVSPTQAAERQQHGLHQYVFQTFLSFFFFFFLKRPSNLTRKLL